MKPPEGHTQNIQSVAAQAREPDLAVHPGQDLKYVVVNDEKSSRENGLAISISRTSVDIVVGASA